MTKITSGQNKQLRRVLNDAADKVVPVPDYCVSLEAQFQRLVKFNRELSFGFSDKLLANAERALKRLSPTWPEQQGTILTLVPYGASVWETHQMHGRAIRATYSGAELSVWHGFQSEHQDMGQSHGEMPTIRLLSGIKHPAKPCIWLERIDLLTHWDKQNGLAPNKVRGKESAHMGLLASAWQHKALVQLQDGTIWPYWNLAGVEVNVPGCELWSHCPYVDWDRDDRYLYWGALDVAYPNRDCSSPVLRECKLLAA